jgi:hypothetical protein
VTGGSLDTTLAALSVDHLVDKEWILDLGASRHFANNANLFTDLDNTPIGTVRSASGQDHIIQGQGIVDIPQPNSEINSIKDVKYIPSLNRNLLSVGQLTDTNKLVIFSKSHSLVVLKKYLTS